MKYRIFRITAQGHLLDIAYKPYNSYLRAENVVNELKKGHKGTNYVILQVY